MMTMLANLKTRPLAVRALAMLVYGVISFLLIYGVGAVVLDNPLISLVLELIWFLHILYVTNKLADESASFITIAICGLLPGLLKNFWLATNL